MNTPVPIAVVESLRECIQGLEGRARHRRAVLPFGIKAIDARLPECGLALGALHEVAGGGNGAVDGAAAALFAAGIAARTRGRVLWCVVRQDLFAPALASAGLAPDQVIYVEAGDEKSVLACFEEGLRHGGLHGGSGLGAVVAEVARLSMTASRRLQLAAEGSGAIGIAIRRLPILLSSPSPSPRLWGEGRGEGDSPQAQTHGKAPSPGICATSAQIPTSPCKRGEVKAVPDAIALPQGGEERFAAALSLNPVASGLNSAPMHPTFLRLSPYPAEQAGESQGERMRERGQGQSADFGQPTAAVTRWRVSALPSAPLPVAGVGRARWRLELIRCRGGESAEFEVEACDAQGRLALPSDLVHGSGQKAIGRRRTTR